MSTLELAPIDFGKFCSGERWRSYLAAPFVIGEFTYATNGHVAVRVPGSFGVEATEKMPASIVGLFDEAAARTFRSFEPVDIPRTKRERCVDCWGTGFVIVCGVCDGDGEHECGDDRCGCSHECGNCSGRGVFSSPKNIEGAVSCDACNGDGRQEDRRDIDLGGKLALAVKFLELVQGLPSPIEWAPVMSDNGNYEPTAFRGPGWVALIMPRRWSGIEAIKADRMPKAEVESEDDGE